MNQDYYLSQPGVGHHHQIKSSSYPHSQQVSKQTSSSGLAMPGFDSHSVSGSQHHTVQSNMNQRQPRTTKAKENAKMKDKQGHLPRSGASSKQEPSKGKSAQLAKDYYMMQAFVQQPHHQMSTPSIPASGASSSTAKASHAEPSTNSTGRRVAHKHSAASTMPSATYYTTNMAHKAAGQGHHQHSATSSAKKLHQGGGAHASGHINSEPVSGKRSGAHSAHSGSNLGAGSERTPKTPQTANIFRRKWGGASSTKSQKSQSSQRSAVINHHTFSQHEKNNQDSERMLNNKSARCGTMNEVIPTSHSATGGAMRKKRDKSRPNSSSKTPNLRQDASSKTSNFKTANQQKNNKIFNVMETPPIVNQKAMRSSSSEIRTNQIDFTALVRNRMHTQSTKKMTGAPSGLASANQHAPSAQTLKTTTPLHQHQQFGALQHSSTASPFQHDSAPTTGLAINHQMPPKPAPPKDQAGKGGSNNPRRKSKSKSTSQQVHMTSSGGGQQQIQWSTSHKNILNMKPVVDRNGGTHLGGQSQQAQLTQESAHTKKKLRNLLQSVTLSSGDTALKPIDSALGQLTPSRKSSHKSDSNAKNREADSKNGVPLQNRRISNQSGPKGNKGKNQTMKDRNQMMTPVISQQSQKGNQAAQEAAATDKVQRADKPTKSHRIPAHDTQKMNSNNPLIQTGFKSRHRSASNQKHQQANSQTQILQTQGSQMGVDRAGVKEPSQTDQKKRESQKRKKSATRRGKSAKRTTQPGMNSQTAHHAASHPQIVTQHHGVERGRSPNRNATVQSGQLTTTQGSQSNQMLYSAYRLRTLKPKNNAKQQKDGHHAAGAGGSVSLERHEKMNHVGLLNKGENQAQQLLMQSGSSGNSVCSAGKGAHGGQQHQIQYNTSSGNTHLSKEQKLMSKTAQAQKNNKMLTNIQQQVIQGSKNLGTKRIRQQQESAKKLNTQTEKRHKQAEKEASSQIKVDLMKASLIADIRIDTRMQRQSHETGTPSDSLKSGKRTSERKEQQQQAAAKKLVIKPRSVSSDERLQQQSIAEADRSGSDSLARQHEGGKNSDSPKFLLSLRQLEKLLFSSQKISSQLKKSAPQQKAAQRSRKQLIQNSLKVLSQNEAAQALVAGRPPTKSQAKAVTAGKPTGQSPSDKQFITIQPASVQVFNGAALTGDDRLSNNIAKHMTAGQLNHMMTMTPGQAEKSQSHTQSVAQLAMETGEKQVTLRMKTQDQDEGKTGGMSRQLLQVTARKIQDKISKQQSNLLSLVDLQKMRAQRMATTYNKKPEPAPLPVANLKTISSNSNAKQIYKEYSNQEATKNHLHKEHQRAEKANVAPAAEVDSNSAQRLHNLIYAKLESRQTPMEQRRKEEDKAGDGAAAQTRQTDSVAAAPPQPKEAPPQHPKQLSPQVLREPQKAPNSVTPEQLEIECRSSTTLNQEHSQTINNVAVDPHPNDKGADGERSSRGIITDPEEMNGNAQESSFLDRVVQGAQDKSTAKGGGQQQTQPDEQSSKHGQNAAALTANEVDEKDASMCSLKQPSLRQITSSHTSRSNKLLQRQESADQIRRSQDPNASITLSRILLETSMQQSERGPGSNTIGIAGNQYQQQSQQAISEAKRNQQQRAKNSQAAAFAAGAQAQHQQKFQRLRSDMAGSLPDSQNNNDIMSYQSISSAKVLSEANNHNQHDDSTAKNNQQEEESASDKLRAIPRSYTNAEKSDTGKDGGASNHATSYQNSSAKMTLQHQFQKTSPLHNFRADEAWPTNSSRRKRKSSITSLSNSTPGSRTLEQLQYQSHAQSLQSPSSQQNNNGNSNQHQTTNSCFPGGTAGSPSHKAGGSGTPSAGKTGGRSSQMIFDEAILDKIDKDLIERSPLQYQKGIQQSLMEQQLDEQLIVHDQAEGADSQASSQSEGTGEEDLNNGKETKPASNDQQNFEDGENTPSMSGRVRQPDGTTAFDDEAMMGRGTSSPKRRRSPANPMPSPSHGLHPIQLDNSTSFVNDDFDDVASSADRHDGSPTASRPLSQAHEAAASGALQEPTNIDSTAEQQDHHRGDDLIGSNRNINSIMTRSVDNQGGVITQQQQQSRNIEESSYEDIAPYEKSQNEGLNQIMFQGANNWSDDAAEVGYNEEEGAEANQDAEFVADDDVIVNQEDINLQLIDENSSSLPRNSPVKDATTTVQDNEDDAQKTQESAMAKPAEAAMDLITVEPISRKKISKQDRQFSDSTQGGGGQSILAPIEDVLILTPQSPFELQNSPSPASRGRTPQSEQHPALVDNKSRSPQTEPSKQQSGLSAIESESFKEACEMMQRDEESNKVVQDPDVPVKSSSNIVGLEILEANKLSTMIKSEKMTPLKVSVVAGAEAGATLSTEKISEPTAGRQSEKAEFDVLSHDQLRFPGENVISPNGGVQLRGSSFASSEVLDFEEAVNVEVSPSSLPTNGGSPTKVLSQQNNKVPALTTAPTGIMSAPQSILGKKSPLIKPSGAEVAAKGKLFDIDSLNEINKANDLASKKIEITNFIFEALVGEIKDNLFPLREDDYDYEDASSMPLNQNSSAQSATGATKKKKKKKKVARTVKKPTVMPKIKEIRDGQPADMCLNRIQIQASKMRRSLGATASPDFTASLSVTQSLSASKELDNELGFTHGSQEPTKSKEQLEASQQFHQLELRKQEQLELMQKQLQLHEESKTTSQREDDDLKQLANNLRGIKTSTDVVDQYLSTLFDTLLNGEQEFLDNLATPFSLNPLQELINLQVLANQARHQKMDPQEVAAAGSRKMLSIRRTSSMMASMENDLEVALFGFAQQQHPVLSVEIYLDIERKKEYVLLADSLSEIDASAEESTISQQQDDEDGENPDKAAGAAKKANPAVKKKLVENQSMLAEWENIHNKVLFDAVNDALDEFRPYGLRGPPAPWSGQTRALTYRYSQNAKEVLQQVQDKVVSLSKTFGGALANSELLREYHIRGPLELDKLQMLREERLAIMMMQDVEETQHKWEDLERQETGVKVELADIILEQLAQEIVDELAVIGQRSFEEK